MPGHNSGGIIPVILCGGSGSRLWPVSRATYPKPFIGMKNGNTLFKDTLLRAKAVKNSGRPIIICNDAHRFYVLEALAQCQMEGEIILEPCGRNTAPAIALGAFAASSEDPLILVMPSDHIFSDDAVFAKYVEKAAPFAREGRIVTFGIDPDSPKTGYGYIEKGQPLGEDVFAVMRFIEKPDMEKAAQMIKQGGYYWNSGIFLMPASLYLEDLQKYAPEIYASCLAAWQNRNDDLSFIRPEEKAFCETPQNSIDYAVMERTTNAAVCGMNIHWNDLGSWESFYQEEAKDSDGNVILGDVVAFDTKDSYLYAEDKFLAVIGVKDLAVVETRDSVLVVSREKAQEVRKIVEYLKKNRRREYNEPSVVLRPWGEFESLAQGPRFQVKKIVVKPGGQLSLQMHHHRAEHWVVVKGTAEITIDDSKRLITENQSVYIPVGATHKLVNPGIIPLEIIEIQSGPYLGEDDIRRFEDIYGRK